MRIDAHHLHFRMFGRYAAQIHERLTDIGRDRFAGRDEGADRADRLAIDAIDLRILGDQRRGLLLRYRRIPHGRHRLGFQNLDARILGEIGLPAGDLSRRHRIARRAAEHDDVALAVESLDQPFRSLLADLGLTFGYAIDVVLTETRE